jgi:arylsulfatase A-like enzyme
MKVEHIKLGAMKKIFYPVLVFLISFHCLSASEKPNVVFIVADDMGWADIGYHNAEIRSPNLDKLAKAGIELDCHYVQPQCTPTRVALMTGQYPMRINHKNAQAHNEEAFSIGTQIMSHMFKKLGYTTAIMGKWHMGCLEKWGPKHHAFDYSYGSYAGAVGMYDHRYTLTKKPYSVTWHRNHELVEEEGHVTDLVRDEAVSWIHKNKDKPFFL